MSEALNKFILGKAKTRAAFNKKFSGQDGAISLMEMVGDAPKGVQKQAQKIFEANADDVEKAVSEIANLAYGSKQPAKRTGARGKTSDPPERIEGDNLPNNASDSGTLAPVPEEKGGSKRGRKAAAKTPPATDPAPKQEAAAAEAEGDDGELDTSIGQFVPAAQFTPEPDDPIPGALGISQSQLDDAAEPIIGPAGLLQRYGLSRGDLSESVNPLFPQRPAAASAMDMSLLSRPQQSDSPAPNTPAPIEPKADPAPSVPPGLSSQDMDYLSSMGLDFLAPAPTLSQLDLSDLIGGGTAKPRTSPTMYGPFSDGLFDMNSGTAIEPPANPALPGTISPDGGFLGMDQTPTMFNREGGFMDGEYGPTQFNNAGGVMDGDYGPPASMAPPTKRPPFYDPNRTMSQWWNEPGIVSRANEFLYQRGMPAGLARAIQPTASAIDKGLKVGGPLVVGGVAGRAALQGMGALANMGQESTAVVPPTDEEQAALEAKADESMRQLQQILGGTTLRNPASAPPAAPVK